MRHRAPEFGSIRVRSGFLFFSKCIGRETRWLEWASWAEEFIPLQGWTPVWWEGP